MGCRAHNLRHGKAVWRCFVALHTRHLPNKPRPGQPGYYVQLQLRFITSGYSVSFASAVRRGRDLARCTEVVRFQAFCKRYCLYKQIPVETYTHRNTHTETYTHRNIHTHTKGTKKTQRRRSVVLVRRNNSSPRRSCGRGKGKDEAGFPPGK